MFKSFIMEGGGRKGGWGSGARRLQNTMAEKVFAGKPPQRIVDVDTFVI